MSSAGARKEGIEAVETDVNLTIGQLVKAAGENVVVCTASDTPVGAATEEATAGGQASIAVPGAINGTVWLIADGAIAKFAYLKPAAAGRVATATTGNLVAQAREAAATQGELIECALLRPVTVA